MTVTLLHPGEMGAAVGACLVSRGARVLWVSEGRSPASRKRACECGLEEISSLGGALEASDAVLSICVPSGAFEVAREVATRNFRGIYVDANAIAPAHSRQIGIVVEAAGARFLDGGIIGLPPTSSRTTRLYLAGPEAASIAELFAGSQTTAIPMEDAAVGAASAIKVCFAAYNKGETALLGIIRALAKFEGVDDALMKEWAQSQPGAAQRSENIAARAFKAWRWAGEMEEIAASFDDAGLPSGFLANAEIYRRLTSFKDCAERPSMEEVTKQLTQINASTHHSR
jgi:3-hydroxyisobutyrate dehydrogenase-like beta-hydroxyacid dehydrogenase